jgi:MerR family copper efflux transcriptional regulator
MTEYMQIGEVAERTRLSLRTIRYHEETGLVSPATRSAGGFRLYGEADVDRLRLLRQAKPLGFSLEELRELLGVLDRLDGPHSEPPDRAALLDRLGMFREAARARVQSLRDELDKAESFAALLDPASDTRGSASRRAAGR